MPEPMSAAAADELIAAFEAADPLTKAAVFALLEGRWPSANDAQADGPADG